MNPTEPLHQSMLLLPDSPAALRDRLASAGGELARLRDWVRQQVKANPAEHGDLAVLLAVLGEGHADAARRWLVEQWRHPLEHPTNGGYQHHTWCFAGRLLRPVAMFNWLDAIDPWTDAQRGEAARGFLSFGLHHVYPTLCSRTRAADNQCFAMALYCAVTGQVFADHPAGWFLKAYGGARLRELIGLFPRDGYGFEGSTYTSHVNTPLFCWTHALWSQRLGRDVADQPFEPNGTTLRRAIEMEMRITGPAGWQAPWDSYGWQRASHAAPFAYLARLTGNPGYLSLIKRFSLGRNREPFAWGADDAMWTLLWWPDEFADWDDDALDPGLFGFCLPTVGAALDDTASRTRLFQVWDRSAETVSGVGRAQVNPNHVMFEHQGQPVLTDGSLTRDGALFEVNPELVFSTLSPATRQRLEAYVLRLDHANEDGLKTYTQKLAIGLIGASNSVLVDGEMSYWPGKAAQGQAVAYGRSDALSAVSSDAAAFYNPRYAMRRARRTSVWHHGLQAGVIVDDMQSDQPHEYTWQGYVTPHAQVDAAQAAVRVPMERGPAVTLAFAGQPTLTAKPVPGFPRDGLTGGSVRLHAKVGDEPVVGCAFAVVISGGATVSDVVRTDDATLRFKLDGVGQELTLPAGEGALHWRREDGASWQLTMADAASDHVDVLHLPDVAFDDPLDATPPAANDATLHSGDNWLGRTNRLLAQLHTAAPDEALLRQGLADDDWRVASAAAEVIGRTRVAGLAAPLRDRLSVEHALPQAVLYPALDDEPDDLDDAWRQARRWRLKLALILAIGRLRDEQAIELIGQIVADGWDFYPVLSACAKALNWIGTPATRAALTQLAADVEINTRTRAEDGLEALDNLRASPTI